MEEMPTNRLSRLRVSGFKSIRALDLTLGSLNVLIGPNGAGKSNLLSFLRMLGALAEGRLSRFVAQEGGANMLLHHGRKRTPEIGIEVSFHDGQRDVTYRVTLGGAPPDTFFLEGEEITSTTADGQRTALSHGDKKAVAFSLLTQSPGTDEQAVAHLIQGLTHYHFHDTSAEAPIRQRSAIDDNRSLRDNGGNLAAFLYLLRRTSPRHYESIRDTIRLATPFFDDFVLEPHALDPKTIQLEWRERGSDMLFFAHQLSDGTLRFIALATALLQPDPPPDPSSLDEPELGLHPYALTLLASLVRSVSRSRQIIVATQSVTLLDELAEPDEVIVVERRGSEREGSESLFRRLDPEALRGGLEEYTLGELWEKNVLGGRP